MKQELFLAILYILLGNIFILKILFDFHYAKTWTLNIWVQIFLLIYYVIVPLIMIISSGLLGRYLGNWPDLTINHEHYCSFGTFISVMLFFTAYTIIILIPLKLFSVIQINLKLGNFLSFPLIKLAIILIVIFAYLSFFIYVKGYHGLSNLIKLAPYLESPVFQEELYLKYGRFHRYFLRFVPMIIYPALFFFFFKRRYERLFFIILPVIIYLIYTLLTRERQATILLILVFIIGFLIKYQRIFSKGFLIVCVILLLLFPFITFINKTFSFDVEAYRQIKNAINIDYIIKEFNFEQIALYISQNATYKKFIFDDFINSLFGNFLPTSLRYKEPLNNLNSYFFMGQLSHSIPPGIIASGYYHLGNFGIIIWGMILGITVKLTESIFNSLMYYDRNMAYPYAFSFLAFFAYIRTGILGFSLYRPFYVFFLIIILIGYRFYISEKNKE